MRWVVVSEKHGLLRTARWLALEQEDVFAACRSDVYQKRAWQGLLEKQRLPKRDRLGRNDELVAALRGEATLVTDSESWTAEAVELKLPRVFGRWQRGEAKRGHFALGGWWGPSGFSLPHWVLRDWGLWPGGLGPIQVAGLTLARASMSQSLQDVLQAALEGVPVFGAVQLEIGWSDFEQPPELGALVVNGDYHLQLLLHSQPKVAPVLRGEVPPVLPYAYTVGALASVAPYPFGGTSQEKTTLASGPESLENLLLYDVSLARDGKITTGGINGLVAIAVGRGQLLSTARHVATKAVLSMGLPELQVRPDVAEHVDAALGQLETMGLLAP